MARPAEIDDWITPAAAPPAGGEDDWIGPDRPAPTLDAAHVRSPSIRERIGGAITGEAGYHSFWGRLARGLVGSSGLGREEQISAGDMFPVSAAVFAGDEISGSRNPLEAVGHAVAAIPAPGVGPAVQGVRAATLTAAQQQAAAAARLNVPATRAVDSSIAEAVGSVAPLVQNPARAAAGRELEALTDATEGTLRRASPDYAPADASSRAVNDWLSGRARADTDAVAETAALRTADAPPARPEPTSGSAAQEVVTPDGSSTVRATPEVVELSDLQLASGRFQQRDRSRAEYVQEARERATRLDPARLQPERVADSGAPVALPDGTILSGNGRAMSIAEVYRDPALAERAQAYRASLGPEAANMRQPVLVMRTEALADDAAEAFANGANQSRIAQMSATERAGRDANALGVDGVALYQGGEFTAPQNAAFLRAFTERAVTSAERPAFSKGAELTQEGVNRMRAAVLHGAYEDAALISRMLESTDDNIRNLTGALTDAAPGMLALRADIRAGVTAAEMDASQTLTDAAKLIADLRSRGVAPASHFAQADAFNQTDPLVEAWVRAFYNDDLTRPVSRSKMAEVIDAYTAEARKHAPAGSGLFDDQTTSKDVLNVAARRGQGETAQAAQGQLAGIPEGVGAGIPEGGPAPQGRAPARVSEAPGKSVSGNAGTAQAGKPALSAEDSERAVVQNLSDARRMALARAIGEPVQAATAERITARLAEMARSKLPADVSGLLRAREILGADNWRNVSAGVLHRLGAVEGGWDLVKFGQAWEGMTKTGRQVLFSGNGMPRGFHQALDDLATLSARVPRLREMTDTEMPDLLRQVLTGRGGGGIVGWGLMHALTGGASVGLHGVQAAGWALSKFLSRPMAAKATSAWARAMTEFAKDVNPKTVAMLKFSTQQLIDAGGDDGSAR